MMVKNPRELSQICEASHIQTLDTRYLDIYREEGCRESIACLEPSSFQRTGEDA